MSDTFEAERVGEIRRTTRETDVFVRIDLQGPIISECRTGVPFLDHMLDQIAQHGRMGLTVTAAGDVEIDDHHTVEDVGITLGQALTRALGDKRGIVRAASMTMPMDDALVLCSLDLSGRPFLACDLDLRGRRAGAFDCELTLEFFRAVAMNSGMTIHIRQLAGVNVHHVVEAAFKAFARALDAATTIDNRIEGVPSTKGVL
jgi:imidazoleglycerol-phosphate dehydratase